nr:cache domain-containing protein [Treponema sp.]
MTSGQKTAFSLLTAMILFAAFVLLANPRLNIIKNLEKQYYSQARIREKVQQLDELSQSYNDYITKILKTLEEDDDSFTKSQSILSYLDYYPSEKLIEERRKQTIKLFEDLETLDGIRIVDSTGRYLHYSSFEKTDLVSSDNAKKVYERYNSLVDKYDELAFESIAPDSQNPQHRILLDENKQRLIISLPLYRFNEYSAVLFCYFNFDDIQKMLSAQDCIYGQTVNIIGSSDFSGGLVLGIPPKNFEEFKEPIINFWKNYKSVEGKENDILPEKILQIESDRYWEVLTSKKATGLKVSGVYTSDIFELSQEVIILIYLVIGITLFLISFLLFNIKGDTMTELRKKVRRIQYGVIKEYLDNRENVEWEKVVKQIQLRKNDLSKEIIKSVRLHSKNQSKELTELLDKNWDEIFAVLLPKTERNESAAVTKEDIRQMLEEVLKETKLNVNLANVGESLSKKKTPAPEPVEEIEEVEEAEPVEEIEEVEEAEPVEEIEEIDEAQPVEEIEEIEEVQPVEEIEEIDEAEPVEEIEEIDEAEPVEEIEEVEEAEPVEEIEEVEEAEPVDEIEEVEEAEPVEEIEEIEEAEPVEEIEEIDEAEPVEEIEEIDEAEPVDEIEEVEEAEPVEEIEEIEEAEPVEEIEEIDEAEPVEEIEEIDEAEPVEEIEEIDEAQPVEEIEEVEEAQPVEEIEEIEEAQPVEEIEDIEVVEDIEALEEKAPDPFMLASVLAPPINYDYKESNDSYI